VPMQWYMLLAVMLAVLAHGAATCTDELVSDPDFSAGTGFASIVDSGRSSGTYSTVSAATGMESFPGDAQTALQLLPPASGGRTVTTLTTPTGYRSAGWFHVTCFVFVSSGASAGASITVQVVDAAAAAVPGSAATPIPLRPIRGEWLHYDVWVPSNRAGVVGVSLSVAPGAGFSGGELQLSRLSVCFEPFSARMVGPGKNLEAIDFAEGLTDSAARDAMLLSKVACSDVACPPAYGSSRLLNCLDGSAGSSYDLLASRHSTVTIELDLGSPVEICAVELLFDSSCCFASGWRLQAGVGATTSGARPTVSQWSRSTEKIPRPLN
jgi:hypothetical protein